MTRSKFGSILQGGGAGVGGVGLLAVVVAAALVGVRATGPLPWQAPRFDSGVHVLQVPAGGSAAGTAVAGTRSRQFAGGLGPVGIGVLRFPAEAIAGAGIDPGGADPARPEGTGTPSTGTPGGTPTTGTPGGGTTTPPTRQDGEPTSDPRRLPEPDRKADPNMNDGDVAKAPPQTPATSVKKSTGTSTRGGATKKGGGAKKTKGSTGTASAKTGNTSSATDTSASASSASTGNKNGAGKNGRKSGTGSGGKNGKGKGGGAKTNPQQAITLGPGSTGALPGQSSTGSSEGGSRSGGGAEGGGSAVMQQGGSGSQGGGSTGSISTSKGGPKTTSK